MSRQVLFTPKSGIGPRNSFYWKGTAQGYCTDLERESSTLESYRRRRSWDTHGVEFTKPLIFLGSGGPTASPELVPTCLGRGRALHPARTRYRGLSQTAALRMHLGCALYIGSQKLLSPFRRRAAKTHVFELARVSQKSEVAVWDSTDSGSGGQEQPI